MRKEPPDTCCVSNTGENMRVAHMLKGMPRCAVPKLGCFLSRGNTAKFGLEVGALKSFKF
jgi:hypothetical protein